MNGVMDLTLRAQDGRERRNLVYLPTAAMREEYFARAAKWGLEVIEN